MFRQKTFVVTEKAGEVLLDISGAEGTFRTFNHVHMQAVEHVADLLQVRCNTKFAK